MSQEDWYYLQNESAIGPVAMSQLKSLYSGGQLTTDTLVRRGADGPWEALTSILDLSSDEVTAADLDRFLASDAPSDPETAVAGADDLAGMLASDSEIPVATSGRSPAPQTDRDRRWYCQILGQELGPFEFDDLHEMVTDGELSPSDLVRVGQQGKWEPASTIVGLFEGAPAESSPTAPQGGSTGFLSPQRGALPQKPSKDASSPRPAAAPASSEDDDEAIWFYRVLSQELGPVTLGQLMEMAQRGSLSPNDEIRMSGVRQWMPASSMAGLFTDEQLQEAEPTAPASPKSAADKPQPSPSVPEKTAPAADSKESPKTAPPDSTAAAPKPKATPTTPTSTTPTPPPRPASAPSAASPSMASRPSTASRAFTPPPKTARKRSSGGGGGSSFSIGEMFSGIQLDPKLLGGLALGIAVILSLYVLPTVLSAGAGRAAYDETLVVWKQIQAMKQVDAAPSRWAELKTQIEGRHKEFVDELAESASAKRRLLQLMLFCQRDCIMQIISSNGTNEAKYSEMKTYMDEAATLVGN